MSLQRAFLIATILMSGCAGATDEAEQADPLFDPTRLIEVAIDLDADDWAALKLQTREESTLFSGDCLSQPWGSPFTYFNATVTVDGTTLSNVGVRKKGFLGSLSETKPGFKIKFSEFVKGQKYAGLKRLTLNNSISDPSYINQCIGYRLFRAAGIRAPRCNFAHVTVNGQDLGVYVNVETVKKEFLERNFDDSSGNLYAGTLSDFRTTWRGTFERKTNKLDTAQPEIDEMVAALALPDDQLLAALAPLMDIDHFVDYWTMEVLLGAWDGYAGDTNNFYVYHDPKTGQLQFMPWGLDTLLEDESPVYTEGVLAHRFYRMPETRAKYDARLQALVDAWDVPELLAEIDRMKALIEPHIPAGELALFQAMIAQRRAFIQGRRQVVMEHIADGPVPIPDELRAPWCASPTGEVTATFTTTWGTLEDDPFSSGAGTLVAQLDDQTFNIRQVGSAGGADEEGNAIIGVFAELDDGTTLMAFAQLAPDALEPNTTVEGEVGILIHDTGQQEPALEAELRDITFTFTQASSKQGSPIVGTLTASVFSAGD